MEITNIKVPFPTYNNHPSQYFKLSVFIIKITVANRNLNESMCITVSFCEATVKQNRTISILFMKT